jgi:hypothetical protein
VEGAVIFIHLKIHIPTELCRRDSKLADKIALLEQIKNQPPNTSHHQLAEIMGVPKFAIGSETARRIDITPQTTGNPPSHPPKK